MIKIVTISILILCSAFFLFNKKMNYFYYKTFVKQPTMIENTPYIVQYVGFKTSLNETAFLKRWTPFATRFKNVGIKNIDLYKISNKEELTFISRNIWDTKTYFHNFPTGVTSSGSGGGIAVTQFGGYWIAESEIEKPTEMKILFTNESISSFTLSRKRCTEKVHFENQFEFSEKDSVFLEVNPLNILNCTHIKTM